MVIFFLSIKEWVLIKILHGKLLTLTPSLSKLATVLLESILTVLILCIITVCSPDSLCYCVQQ